MAARDIIRPAEAAAPNAERQTPALAERALGA